MQKLYEFALKPQEGAPSSTFDLRTLRRRGMTRHISEAKCIGHLTWTQTVQPLPGPLPCSGLTFIVA